MRVGGYASPSGVSGNTGVIDQPVDAQKDPVRTQDHKTEETLSQPKYPPAQHSDLKLNSQDKAVRRNFQKNWQRTRYQRTVFLKME